MATRRRSGLGASWLLIPGLTLIALSFVWPVGLLLSQSFTEAPGGLAHYEAFLTSTSLVKILFRTIWTALVVTIISFLIGYPFAYLAATTSARARTVLISTVAASLFISLVVRCYAWLAILDRGGLINALLTEVGLREWSIVAVHNFPGVLIGVTQFTLPFMILPVFDVMRRFDRRLRLASASLGANPLRTFIHVYFPLTLPGVIAGSAIVFITTMGYYIAPSILGGPQNVMIGELIAIKMRRTVEWGLGTAISSVLLVAALALFVLYYRALGRYQEIKYV